MCRTIWASALLLSLAWLGAAPVHAQDDVADVVSVEKTIGKQKEKKYYLIGPAVGHEKPKEGYGLLVVLPGGDGSADFHPFVKRIFKHAMPEGYVIAQPVAVKWTPQQKIVWPTAKTRVEKMQFTTEEFIEQVIEDVKQQQTLNPERIFTLSWSSSGPAAYAAALSNKKITGSFIAMSVFKPNELPALTEARGRGFYLYHASDDRVCPYRMAEQAHQELERAQAKVTLKTTRGGHGWRVGTYLQIREGLQWLEQNHGPPGM